MYNAMGFYHCANIPAAAVPPHVPRSHGSALRFQSFRLHFTVKVAAVPPHSPGSLNSASQSKQSQSKQSQLCLTFQGVTVPPPSPGSLNFASQSKQSQLRLTTPAIPAPPHSTIQIKYSFPSSLIFCRDFWILMRILSGTPAILFSICSATIS